MNVAAAGSLPNLLPNAVSDASLGAAANIAQAPDDAAVREAFDSFVGESFYREMLKAMRKTLGKPAYFHGGRAEEMFRSQLDETLAQELTKSNGGALSEALYQQQFMLLRR